MKQGFILEVLIVAAIVICLSVVLYSAGETVVTKYATIQERIERRINHEN